jgi:hypothetical protein
VSGKSPGFLINKFIADIDPAGLTIRKKGKMGHRATIGTPSLASLRTHLETLDHPGFTPETCPEKGYTQEERFEQMVAFYRSSVSRRRNSNPCGTDDFRMTDYLRLSTLIGS